MTNLTMSILDRVNSPKDLRMLDINEMYRLSDEMREEPFVLRQKALLL